MNDRRSRRYPEYPESRIYYPSGSANSSRRSRFQRRNADTGTDSTSEKRSPLSRFRPHSDRRHAAGSAKQKGKRFRPHSTAADTSAKSASRPSAAAAPVRTEPPVPPRYRESDYQPAYPYYPAPTVYPPPPPPYAYAVYDPYGRRLSEADVRRMEELEALEDRYGRDFDRYAGRPADPSGKKEIFPKNYLVDEDDQ